MVIQEKLVSVSESRFLAASVTSNLQTHRGLSCENVIYYQYLNYMNRLIVSFSCLTCKSANKCQELITNIQ